MFALLINRLNLYPTSTASSLVTVTKIARHEKTVVERAAKLKRSFLSQVANRSH